MPQPLPLGPKTPNPQLRLHLIQRRTKRASVSLPQSVYEELMDMADEQGRSLSNVMAFLLESHLEEVRKNRKPARFI